MTIALEKASCKAMATGCSMAAVPARLAAILTYACHTCMTKHEVTVRLDWSGTVVDLALAQ